MNIVFSPAISDAAWAIGKSLLPQGFTIEILAQDPERRIEQLERADFLMGFLRGLPLVDILAEKRPGDVLAMVVLRDGKEVTLQATLVADSGGARQRSGTLCRLLGGSGQRSGAAVGVNCRCRNARRSPEAWPLVCQCGLSLASSAGPRRR